MILRCDSIIRSFFCILSNMENKIEKHTINNKVLKNLYVNLCIYGLIILKNSF